MRGGTSEGGASADRGEFLGQKKFNCQREKSLILGRENFGIGQRFLKGKRKGVYPQTNAYIRFRFSNPPIYEGVMSQGEEGLKKTK